MGQIKLEKQIKEKLNLREIQPSAQAWNRLDAMLSVSEEKKTKSSIRWIYIAAGIIGFLFVGSVFYNQNQANPIIANPNQVIVNTKNQAESTTKIEQSIVKKQIEISDNQSQIVKNDSKKNIKKAQNQEQKVQEFVKINEPKQEIIAELIQYKIIKESNPESNPDLQTILAANNKEIKILNKPKLKIDPSTLLSEVDTEITLTFRQKLFKSINKNYDNAKDVLASRNME